MSDSNDVKYPEVEVRLTGVDSNIGAIMGAVTRAMRRAGLPTLTLDEYRTAVFSSGSYDEALQVTMQTVSVS